MMSGRLLRLIPRFFLLGLFFSGCSLLPSRKTHQLEISGPYTKQLKKDLESLVSEMEFSEGSGLNRELLELYSRGDAKNMESLLRAEGYYRSHITHGVISKPYTTARFEIETGPAFQLHHPDYSWKNSHSVPGILESQKLRDLKNIQPASTRNILLIADRITRTLKEDGYPDARVAATNIIVDHAATNVSVTFEINPGAHAQLGMVTAIGLKKVDSNYVAKARNWTNAQPYDIRTLESFERKLAASGLFSTIITRLHQSSPGEDTDSGSIPYDVQVTLKERKARSIQVGVGYQSDTGAESSFQLQHRNLLGQGENLTLRGSVNEKGFDVGSGYTVPFLFRPDQQWISSLQVREEETDAYITRAVDASSRISREINAYLDASAGAAIHYLRERLETEENSFLLLSYPLSLDIDMTDDPLDACKGIRILADSEPYQGLKDTSQFFWKNTITAGGYVPFNRRKSISLAARFTAGHINGDALDDIPAETRFYAGGGHSVRGYAYQSLSPRDNEQIVGGMSLIESSFELRTRVSPKLGLVAFIDGGSAYEKDFEIGNGDFRWGAGAGFRYYTPVGPLRLDIGFPLERRPEVDDEWQFYISIGQAF